LEQQDMNLDIPWYYTGGAVETYMVGILSQEQEEMILPGVTDLGIINGYMPALIWLHSLPSARVFVVNGEYMEDATGLGILSAMASRMDSYDIYPVVNAQNMVLIHFPWIADGTNEVLEEMYGRTSKEVLRDVIWPSMMAIVEQSNVVPTCLMQLQFAYDGSEIPLESDLLSYIKLMREIKAEVGLALSSDTTQSAAYKIASDQENYKKWLPDFEFYSYALDSMDRQEWEQIRQAGLLPQVKTVFAKWEAGSEVLSYETPDVTRQSATSEGFTHTYSDDLRLKSLETIMAYSSIEVDMEKIAEPVTQEDTWESRYEQLAANTKTYWKPFSVFAQTTLIQSDVKIRKYLNVTYTKERTGDLISVDIQNVTGEMDFLLRTFQETVDQVKGGTYQLVEEGVYLVTANQPHLEITLNPLKPPYYYKELS
jgi:hypothetical protein